MKKVILCCIISMLFGINAAEKKLDIKGVLVREFSEDELKIAQYDRDLRYPHAIYFDNEGRISICDPMNSRIAKFNKDFDLIHSLEINQYFPYSTGSYNYEDNENMYQFTNYGMVILNKTDMAFIRIAMPHMRNEFIYDHGMFINNTYIHWTKDNEIYSIENPQGDDFKKNNLKLQGNNKTLELLRSKEFSSIGYTVDDKKRIFLNGELITRSFPVFWYYWNDKSVVLETNGKVRNPLKMNSTRYLGKDNDGNFIWHSGTIVMVFNKTGQMIYHYYSSDIKGGIYTQKDGDIYILKNKEYPMKLLKIEKQW